MVGTSHSRVDLRVVQGGHRRAGSTGYVFKMRRDNLGAGSRRARHLVLFRTATVYNARLAGENSRSIGILSDHAVDYRLRDPVLLGCPHDYVRMPFHAGT